MNQQIRERWPTAAAFYTERDDRTRRIIANLDDYAARQVQIVAAPGSIQTVDGQRMLLLAANLMARWARNVAIICTDTPLDHELRRGRYEGLAERVLDEMHGADPFGNFTFDSVPLSNVLKQEALRLFIGDFGICDVPAAREDFFVSASGWSVLGSRGRSIPRTPLLRASGSAVGLAASLGVADVFKRAVRHEPDAWLGDFEWCTYSHRYMRDGDSQVPAVAASKSAANYDRVLVAGVGAIGSSLAYVADLVGARGVVGVLDYDIVDATNLNRSPLFTVRDVVAGRRKTACVQEYLNAGRLEVLEPFDGTWEQHITCVQNAGFTCWVSTTNERGAWAMVPYQTPPLVAHATTTKEWGFAAGWHVPGRDDCTACRMPRPAAEFRARCAEAEVISPEGERTVASLPFLSAAAASLLHGELEKLLAGDTTGSNHVIGDLANGLRAVVTFLQRLNPSCPGCRAAVISAAHASGAGPL